MERTSGRRKVTGSDTEITRLACKRKCKLICSRKTGPLKTRENDVESGRNFGETTMKKSRFTDEQIVFALKQAESGVPVEEVCRKIGVSQQTFYRWKKKFGDLGVTELRKLKSLEDENKRLKSLVADLSLDKQILQDVLAKKL